MHLAFPTSGLENCIALSFACGMRYFESEHGKSGLWTLKMRGNLVLTLKRLNRLDEAEALAREGPELSRNAWGDTEKSLSLCDGSKCA